MPGQGSYGPAGKWVHDRAHGILQDNPEMSKGEAYAIATQQGHKVSETPKDFRTPQGVHEAKMKYDAPKSEYQKTATWTGFFDELDKIEKEAGLGKSLALAGGLAGAGLGGGHMISHAAKAVAPIVEKAAVKSPKLLPFQAITKALKNAQ